MRIATVVAALLPIVIAGSARAQGKFPPDTLTNVKVIPRSTPVINVIGMMRNFTSDLGVRCQYCHIGEEGKPLDQFNFVSDEKRTKVVARQMMLMLAEINRRVDTLPGHGAASVVVTCNTCHRGVSRPVPLSGVIADAAMAAGADSAVKAYRAIRARYFGRDAYDFGEGSLNTAAFRLGRANKFDDGLSILRLNEELFPNSSGMYVFRGNINLMKGDTAAAAAAFREAIRRDTSNAEAKGRLRAIGRQP